MSASPAQAITTSTMHHSFTFAVGTAVVPPPPPPVATPTPSDTLNVPPPFTFLSEWFKLTTEQTFVNRGDSVEWIIRITNLSGRRFINVEINALLPNGLNLRDFFASKGFARILGDTAPRRSRTTELRQITVGNGATALQWLLDSVEMGEEVTLRIVTDVSPSFSGSVLEVITTAKVEGADVASARQSVFFVQSLPATGETPIWRTALIVVVLGALSTFLALIFWRRRTTHRA